MSGIGLGDSLDASDPYSAAFQPSRLTVPQLRSLLHQHDVYVLSNVRKAGLIEAYEENIRANADELRAKRNRDLNIRPDARGITSMAGSPLAERPPAPAAAAAATSSPGPRKSVGASHLTPARHAVTSPIKGGAETPADQTVFYHSEGDSSLNEQWRPRSAMSRGSTPGSRRSVSWADSVHSEDEGVQSSGSEVHYIDDTQEESGEEVQADGDTSNFSPFNPFQRLPNNFPVDHAPRTGGRKSEPAPRHYANEDEEKPAKAKGAKNARHSIGAPARKRNSMAARKSEAGDAKGSSPAKRHTGPRKSRVAARTSVSPEEEEEREYFGALQLFASLFWRTVSAVAFVYYVYYVSGSKAIGFCDAGRSTNSILETRRLEDKFRLNASPNDAQNWTLSMPVLPDQLQPSCTPCPAHGSCNNGKLISCESGDFVMREPLLAQVPLLHSVLPLHLVAPRCDPDEEKVMLAADLADEIESNLRHWKGDVLCRRARPKYTSTAAALSDARQSDERFAVATDELYSSLHAAAERGSVLRGQDEGFFQELWDLAMDDLLTNQRVTRVGDALVAEKGALGMGLSCRSTLFVARLWMRLRLAVAALLVLLVSTLWLRSRLLGKSSMNRRAQGLIDVALEKLQRAKQRGQATGQAEDGYLAIAQLRDTVLRHETNATQRKQLWALVSRRVEANTNVRTRQAKVQGEWQRVWEWVGPLLDEYSPQQQQNYNSPMMMQSSAPGSRVASYSSNGWNVQPPSQSGSPSHQEFSPQANGFPFRAPGDDVSSGDNQHGNDYNTGSDRKPSAVV